MRVLSPLALVCLAAAGSGCAGDWTLGVDAMVTGIANPRPLPATRHVDRILQVANPEIDVLWVISNAPTMRKYQEKLAKHVPIFFDHFAKPGRDYHLGVVSMSMSAGLTLPGFNGRLATYNGYRYVDPDTPNAEGVFAELAHVGTEGYLERSHDATYAALETEKDGYNRGFLRERSSVHVIAINDYNESSEMTSDELAVFLNGLRADPDDVTYSCIVAYSWPEYVAVTEKVGGVTWNFDYPDWSGMLEQLGELSAGLKREYFLSQLPVPGTIEVSVTEGGGSQRFEEDADWVYNRVRNSIRFLHHTPNPLAEVVIEYELLATDHGA